jgi:superfamily II DNA or RNA helicase
VLVTNAVSVDQWTYQFKLWTTIQDENIGRFTSAAKEWFSAQAGVMICTYSMIAGAQCCYIFMSDLVCMTCANTGDVAMLSSIQLL